MKALGISFGRKMQNSEIMVKQVLKQMKARGFETQFIRMADLDIKDCTGCSACVGSLMFGGNGACVLKDDFPIVEEAILEADAIVVCAPIYVYSPSGTFKTLCDRMGPSHDIAFRRQAVEIAKAKGVPVEKQVDPRAFKERAVAYLTSGGAMTKHWTSLGLPQMYEFGSMGLHCVDAVNVYKTMAQQHIVDVPEVMDRMTKVGDHLADALTTEGGMEKWYGDEEGICPVCHMDLLTVLPGSTDVECPICGIKGKLRIENDVIKVDFPEEEQAHSREKYQGRVDHRDEICHGAMNQRKIPNLNELLKEFE